MLFEGGFESIFVVLANGHYNGFIFPPLWNLPDQLQVLLEPRENKKRLIWFVPKSLLGLAVINIPLDPLLIRRNSCVSWRRRQGLPADFSVCSTHYSGGTFHRNDTSKRKKNTELVLAWMKRKNTFWVGWLKNGLIWRWFFVWNLF